MKLNIKEIKYIRQSLEYRAEYYKYKNNYKQFLDDINKVIKKFIKLEGIHYKDLKSFNKKVNKQMEVAWKNIISTL